MPDKGVTTNVHAVGLGVVDESVSTSKVEVILAGFNSVPLHTVFRCKLVELSFDDGNILRVGEETRIRTGTKVFLTLGHHTPSQTVGWRGANDDG